MAKGKNHKTNGNKNGHGCLYWLLIGWWIWVFKAIINLFILAGKGIISLLSKTNENGEKVIDKNKKKTFYIVLAVIVAVLFIGVIGGDSSDTVNETEEKSVEETDKEKEEKTDDKKEEKEEKKSKDEIFLEKFKKHLDSENSKKLLSILKDDIGFKEVKFVEKIEDTFNYNIKADGYSLVVTDVGDDFRIFIPNSSYVFYEDSKVVLTKKEFKDIIVTSDEASVYYIMAQDIITSCLKDPGSADFPSLNFSPEEIGFKKNGDLVLVQSYVDANNSFGATVRSKWEVQFEVLDMNTYSYDLKYINFDGEKSGSYIDMD